MPVDVAGYLADQQKRAGDAGHSEFAQSWVTMEQLYNKKLWHQLTLHVSQFVKRAEMQTGDALVQFYKNFLCDFEHRINCLALVEVVLLIVEHMPDTKEAVEFLEKVKTLVKSNDEAAVLCMTAVGNIKLKEGDFEASKLLIKETQQLLDTLDEVTTVHGRFYELSSKYHMLMGSHADYYRDALRYLGCVDMADISTKEREERAFSLGLAALLGKNVYNFGELLAHPILQSLAPTPKSWLVDLLYAFNSGDIGKFEALQTHWKQQPDLASQEKHIREKMCLLCLMEMTFRRPPMDRRLTFDEIASTSGVQRGEVELLVMKALSLGLVRGAIDEVEGCVVMTWVQPRVLDKQQVSVMKEKMKEWYGKVLEMEKLVDASARDILS